MLEILYTYLVVGFKHLTATEDADHILFIVCLCAVHRVEDWLTVLKLVTAFTVGHSVTLFLSGMGVFAPSVVFVEWLIPLTIMGTAVGNILAQQNAVNQTALIRYSIVVFFGLIHGMAFSFQIKDFYEPSWELVTVILGFNIGLELAQVGIVVLTLAFIELQLAVFKVKRPFLVLALSAGAILMAATMLYERVLA